MFFTRNQKETREHDEDGKVVTNIVGEKINRDVKTFGLPNGQVVICVDVIEAITDRKTTSIFIH